MATKRQKLIAMAEQTSSPMEAEVAKRKLAATPESNLERIADDIKAEYGKSIESQFAIGRLLGEAKATFGENDREFGQWCNAQDFPFGRTTAYLLRIGAEREGEVRSLLLTRVISGESELGVTKAIRLLTAGPKPPLSVPSDETTPVDPAYAALRLAHRLIVEEGGFATMHIDDLAACAGFIKDLANAYTEAKAARGR